MSVPTLPYENRRQVVVHTECAGITAQTEFSTTGDLGDVDYLVRAAVLVEEAVHKPPASGSWSFGVASVSLASNDRPYP